MAKQTLPTNFQDDVLNEINPKRKYKMIMNDDATVSFEDVTEYDQVGSNFGAAQVNETNTAVNESADKSDIIDSTSDVLANTASGKIASALAVKGLKDYTPMQPSKNYTGDLNDLPTGVFVLDPSKCTNTPSHMMNMWAHVICRKNYSQTVLFYSTVGLPVVAFRSYASNAWTPWKEQGIGFGFNDVWQKGTITSPLLVDLNNPFGEANKTAFVANWNSGTTNLPSDCACGVREVSWVTGPIVMVRITGWTVNTNIPATWVNAYVNGKWLGWSRQTYGTGQLIQSGLSINSGRCKIISGGYYVQNKIAHVQMKIQALTALSSRQFWVMIRGFPQPATESALAITKYNALGKSVGCYVQKSLNVASGEIVITTAGDGIDANEQYVISGDYVVA
jgi:hypothetical protein